MKISDTEIKSLIRVSEQGLFLSCWVQPRASRNKIAGICGNALKITLTAPPVDGKANGELCKFFADLLKIPKSSVELASGQTNRKKVLLLKNVDLQNLSNILSQV